MTTTTMSTAPANDNNEQPPDDELLPDEGETNNKIERSVAAFGNKVSYLSLYDIMTHSHFDT
jgi:hypothetical protein